jgi:SAM-dependent methyltransferase
MGIGTIETMMLLHEHRFRPITGKVLAIGRQHIGVQPQSILNLLKDYGIQPRSTTFEIDRLNVHGAPNEQTISDVSFFHSFSDCEYRTADISSYEGADFVFDICGDLPKNLVGQFDFVTDGGSLDNVFDPFRMLQNMSMLLRPGGRAFTFAWSSGFPSAYVKITPDWIMDYYAVNKYADCKVYVTNSDAPGGDTLLGNSVDIWQFDPLIETGGGPAYASANVNPSGRSAVLCIAEKGLRSTDNKLAVQNHYRGENKEPYLTSAQRFRSSPRPIFGDQVNKQPDLQPISESPAMRPILRLGTPSEYEPLRLVLKWIERLHAEQRMDQQAALVAHKQAIGTILHEQNQQLSRQIYESMVAIQKVRDGLSLKLLRKLRAVFLPRAHNSKNGQTAIDG